MCDVFCRRYVGSSAGSAGEGGELRIVDDFDGGEQELGCGGGVAAGGGGFTAVGAAVAIGGGAAVCTIECVYVVCSGGVEFDDVGRRRVVALVGTIGYT